MAYWLCNIHYTMFYGWLDFTNIVANFEQGRKFILQYFAEIFQEGWKFQILNISNWKFHVKYFILITLVKTQIASLKYEQF